MPTYFQRKDRRSIRRADFATICTRLMCETYGSPVFGPYFGPYNRKILEFEDDNLTNARRAILTDQGYEEVPKPKTQRVFLGHTLEQAFAV